jgi:hypothetical protein
MMKRLGVLVYVVMASAALARAEEGKAAALASLQGMAGVTAAAESTKSLPGVAVGEAAAAMPTIYTAENAWEGLGIQSLLKRLGVQGDAENKALASCQAAGLLNCVVTGSRIISCDSSKCEAIATARELEVVPGARFETVNKDVKFYVAVTFGILETLGVEKSARDQARASCQEKGLLDCVIIGSSITSCDSWSCRATATARGRR